MNEKIAKLKKKISDNAVIITTCSSIAASAAFALYAIHTSRKIVAENDVYIEAREDELRLHRTIMAASEHANETGHSSTIYDLNDNPLIKISPLDEE